MQSWPASMIAGIKEANGNISKIVETAALVGDQLDLYSGNDDEIVPILACGGKGVISVLSNVAPRETAELCRKFFAGRRRRRYGAADQIPAADPFPVLRSQPHPPSRPPWPPWAFVRTICACP